MDSALYVRMAEALLRGSAEDLGPAHHGYPAFVALASLVVPGREWPARAVSRVAGLMLVILVYRLARVRLGPAWSSLAAGLVALQPQLVVSSAAIMTEMVFLLLVALGLLLVERRRFLPAGLVLGAGYIVRPESAIIAPVAALIAPARWRGGLVLLVGAFLAVTPYMVWLRIERGVWSVSPKTALVRPQFESSKAAEWRLGDLDAQRREPQDLMGRLRWAAPSIAAHYLPLLGRHARLLLEAWPPPLLLLSVAGFATWRGAYLAPLPLLLVLPLLAIPLDVRFMQTLLPTLALGAAAGGARFQALARKRAAAATGLVLVLAATGIVWCWTGAAGVQAFGDGPMQPMRAAGEWLRANGPHPGVVMDRKAYVPFFAGMTHVQLPDDEYDRIVEHARTSGVDYIVLEEYASNLRRQMVRLVADPDFQARERRLELVYFSRDKPREGVAIFRVMRDSLR